MDGDESMRDIEEKMEDLIVDDFTLGDGAIKLLEWTKEDVKEDWEGPLREKGIKQEELGADMKEGM